MTTRIWANRFDGQVAGVTGGADGLGYAIAEPLIAEGATVWLLDRDDARVRAAAAKLGARARAHAVDIVDERGVQTAFDGFCRASTTRRGRELRRHRRPEFLVCKHALVQMQKRNYGRVLLIASIAGKEGNAGMCAYSSAKAGVIGLVKSVGKEFAETGITVNALALAVIRTAMVDGMDRAQGRTDCSDLTAERGSVISTPVKPRTILWSFAVVVGAASVLSLRDHTPQASTSTTERSAQMHAVEKDSMRAGRHARPNHKRVDAYPDSPDDLRYRAAQELLATLRAADASGRLARLRAFQGRVGVVAGGPAGGADRALHGRARPLCDEPCGDGNSRAARWRRRHGRGGTARAAAAGAVPPAYDQRSADRGRAGGSAPRGRRPRNDAPSRWRSRGRTSTCPARRAGWCNGRRERCATSC